MVPLGLLRNRRENPQGCHFPGISRRHQRRNPNLSGTSQNHPHHQEKVYKKAATRTMLIDLTGTIPRVTVTNPSSPAFWTLICWTNQPSLRRISLSPEPSFTIKKRHKGLALTWKIQEEGPPFSVSLTVNGGRYRKTGLTVCNVSRSDTHMTIQHVGLTVTLEAKCREPAFDNALSLLW